MTSDPDADWGAEARRLLDDGRASRVYPAASAEAGSSAGASWRHHTGRLTFDQDAPAASADTIFDLASLTKVVATTTIAMRLVERGLLDLERPLCTYLPGWDNADRRTVRVVDLLEHAAGLPAWAPLFESCRSRDAYVRAIAALGLEYAPRSQSVYSDLGFIALGFAIEDAGGAPLDVPVRGDNRGDRAGRRRGVAVSAAADLAVADRADPDRPVARSPAGRRGR